MLKSDKEFIKSYIEAALWSTCDPDTGEMLDSNFGPEDFDLKSLKIIIKDCLSFINQAEKLNLLDNIDYDQAGHDFWLTRNYHGAGFWDRGFGSIGDKLTNLSHKFKSIDLITYPKEHDYGNCMIEIL